MHVLKFGFCGMLSSLEKSGIAASFRVNFPMVSIYVLKFGLFLVVILVVYKLPFIKLFFGE